MFFLRGEERFSKNQEPQQPPPLNPLQLRRKPKAARCRISVSVIFEVPASSEVRLINLRFMLFYEFNLTPQPKKIYVFLKRGMEIFKNSRTLRSAAPKSATTAAETKCRSLPYQYVCYFEVPASSKIRFLNLCFMLFHEFNLRPQPEMIYVFLKRVGEIFTELGTTRPAAPKSVTTAV